jgi:hypothetical protein
VLYCSRRLHQHQDAVSLDPFTLSNVQNEC